MSSKFMKFVLGVVLLLWMGSCTVQAVEWQNQFIWRNIGLSEVVLVNEEGDASIEESVSWDIWQPLDIPLYVGAFVAEDLVNYDDIGAPTAGAMITFDFARYFGWNAPGEPGLQKWDIGFNLEIGVIPIAYDFENEEICFGGIANIIKIEF